MAEIKDIIPKQSKPEPKKRIILEEQDSLSKTETELFSRAAPPVQKGRQQFKKEQTNLSSDWEKQYNQEEEMQKNKPRSKVSLYIFLFSFFFFLIAAFFAAFTLFKGDNTISSKNVSIAISGPTIIAAGDELSLQVILKNNNSVPIELADLIVEYPKGTREAQNTGKELLRLRKTIGDIEPGEEKIETIQAVLFGETDSKKEITFTLEYRVQGSNAISFVEKNYGVTISTSPISLIVSGRKQASAGEELEFTIDLSTNADSTIKEGQLVIEYPFGFSFVSAEPMPTEGDNVWYLGDLPSNSKKKIVLKGKIQGQDGEERVLRFKGGLRDEKDEKELSTVFLSKDHVVTLSKPLLGLAVQINQSTNDVVMINANDEINININWVNNLKEKLANGELLVSFSGSPFIESSVVVAGGGFYRSIDNTAVWNKQNSNEFTFIDEGNSGNKSLRFKLMKPILGNTTLVNPEITVNIKMSAQSRSDLQDSTIPVTTELTRKIKVGSAIGVTSRSLYSAGPITNTGPIPPRVDQETTYTIAWSITNAGNNLRDVKVRAVLPPYVQFTGEKSLSVGSISFNPNTREVLWNAGNVSEGVGYTSGPVEAYFQVALTPSISQLNSSPTILNESTVSGFDTFISKEISAKSADVDTSIETDPGAGFDSGDVKK